MLFKPGVNMEGVQPPIWYACGVVDWIYQTRGYQCTCTSLKDGHDDKPLSLHLKGLAADYRTRNLSFDFRRAIHGAIVSTLNPLGFDIVLEEDHIHVEYDPKKGEEWMKKGEI